MKLRHFILFLFILLNSHYSAFTQQKKIDSLINEYRLLAQRPNSFSNDTNKIKLLNALVWRMSNYTEKLDSASQFADDALMIANKVNWPRGQVESNSGKAKVLRNQNKHDEAISYYQKAAAKAKEQNEKDWTATALYFAGQIFYDQGSYPIALDHFLQALQLNEETSNKSDIARDLTYIGKLYAEIDDYENALNYQLQALKIFQELNNKIWVAINMQDVATIYKKSKNFPKALEYYSKVLDLQKGNIYSTFGTYIDIGNVYNMQSDENPKGQPDTAWDRSMEYYSKGLQTALQLKADYAAAGALNGMGWLYLKKSKLKEADTALHKALNFLLKEKDPEGLRDSYYNLSMLDSLKGNWKGSLQYYKLYTAINDSLFNRRKGNELARLQIKHVTDKKQEEIAILNKDNELKDLRIAKQQKNILLIILTAMILILAGGGYIYYRNKKIKQEALRQISEAKLASLKSLMDKHFIFSSLHSIDTFLMNNDSEAASDYLVKYSKLIRSILEMSNQAEVRIEEEVSLCKSYLDMEKIRLDNAFEYEFSIDGTISMQQTLFPSMLLQPLVENAVKHGIGSLIAENSNKKGLIKIDIAREKDKLICSVTDNGKGLQFSGNTSKSHRSYSGKGIIERVKVYNSLRKNRASFLLKDNNPGVKAILTLPYLVRKQSIAV